MRKAYVQILNSPSEFFEYARWKWIDDKNIKGKSTSIRHLKDTEKGDEFHGNQDEVYDKFAKHKVKSEAALTNDVIGELKSLDFEETKWTFAQRMTEGDSVDVNRYLDGQERCWSGVKRKQRNKKVIRIYSMMGGNCNRSKKELAVNGALAVTMCELLEAAGIGVELWASSYCQGLADTEGKDKITDLLTLVKLKDANEFSDLGVINYVTGDAHVFRNTGFRQWVRKMSEMGKDTNSYLGRSIDITKEDLEGYDDGKSNGVVFIPHIYDINEAKEWLKTTMDEMKGIIK